MMKPEDFLLDIDRLECVAMEIGSGVVSIFAASGPEWDIDSAHVYSPKQLKAMAEWLNRAAAWLEGEA